ncbi:MAG: hypothetical protein Q9M31_08445, partial [Mariprofundus sp.]|nr:hypothetical protein [Mariprofundus sp.]
TLAQPALLFAPWNHHAPHSTSKMDSKWDCRSSTQSFAIGSLFFPWPLGQETMEVEVKQYVE